MKQITLYWPDDQMVEIHLDGKHVADVTSVGPEFPTELFNLLLALPYMTDALKVAVTGLDFAQAQVESENDAYQLRKWLMEVKRVLNKVENGERPVLYHGATQGISSSRAVLWDGLYE
jgi:hypothetical protein